MDGFAKIKALYVTHSADHIPASSSSASVPQPAVAEKAVSALPVNALSWTTRLTEGDFVDQKMDAIAGALERVFLGASCPHSRRSHSQIPGLPRPEDVISACLDVGEWAEDAGALKGTRLTREDAAAIALYTFDYGDEYQDKNPYRLINSALLERNILKLRDVRCFSSS